MNPKGLLARGVPPMPFWNIFLRLAIVLLSILVLAISGWGIDLIQNPPGINDFFKRDTVDLTGLGDVDLTDSSLSGLPSSSSIGIWRGDEALVFALFMAIVTLISTVVITAVERFLPSIYFRIGPLVVYFLNIILLLSAWAFAASEARAIAPLNVNGAPKYYRNVASAYAATAGLAALLWLLVIVNTICFLLSCMQSSSDTRAATQPTTQLGEVPAMEGGYPQSQHPYGQQYNQQYPQQYGPQ